MSPYRTPSDREDEPCIKPRRWPIVVACVVMSMVGALCFVASLHSYIGWFGGVLFPLVAVVMGISAVRKNDPRVAAARRARVEADAEMLVRGFSEEKSGRERAG